VGEGGLISYRMKVEAAWLLHLAELPKVNEELRMEGPLKKALEELSKNVPESLCLRVKEIEKTTNHDVKAVEYAMAEYLQNSFGKSSARSFIHFGCTSEDINNLSYGLMLKDVRNDLLIPAMEILVEDLRTKAKKYAGWPMISRTHGQTATPTTLGKEMAIFSYRLQSLRRQIQDVPILGKMSGAVGNYNAHKVAYPDVPWIKVAQDFVENRLGLSWNPLTTQIENHDYVANFCHGLSRFNSICLDLSRDIWSYISVGYFKQQTKSGEVGSSTMPHKVNPIDFENAEGNLGMANALAHHFAEKLPISRLQRDLSDSTVQRSLGVMLGYSLLAYDSLNKGLGKIIADQSAMETDLDSSWELLGEAVQTVMRRYGVTDAYERLKEATRGQKMGREQMSQLILGCDQIPKESKGDLLALDPRTYIGEAKNLAELYADGHFDLIGTENRKDVP
jgi:adenylosuccinate lyase